MSFYGKFGETGYRSSELKNSPVQVHLIEIWEQQFGLLCDFTTVFPLLLTVLSKFESE